MEMMQEYIKPTMEVIEVGKTDIITTSNGGIVLPDDEW